MTDPSAAPESHDDRADSDATHLRHAHAVALSGDTSKNGLALARAAEEELQNSHAAYWREREELAWSTSASHGHGGKTIPLTPYDVCAFSLLAILVWTFLSLLVAFSGSDRAHRGVLFLAALGIVPWLLVLSLWLRQTRMHIVASASRLLTGRLMDSERLTELLEHPARAAQHDVASGYFYGTRHVWASLPARHRIDQAAMFLMLQPNFLALSTPAQRWRAVAMAALKEHLGM